MKKIFGLFIALTMACTAGLTSCNGNQSTSENSGQGNEQTHEHSATVQVVFDSEYHWYACDCGEVIERYEHVKNPATQSDGTNEWHECVVCGAKMEEKAHTHTFGEAWAHDADGHFKVCTVCGKAGEKTAHALGVKWLADEHGHWQECGECHAKLNKGEHTKNGEWTQEGTNHAQLCGVCNEKIEAAHTAVGGYTTDGEYHWQTCVCGAEIAKSEHNIGYIDEENVKYCDCGENLGVIKTELSAQIMDLAVENGVVTATQAEVDFSELMGGGLTVRSAMLNGSAVDGELTVDGKYIFSISGFTAEDAGTEIPFEAEVDLEGVQLTVRTSVLLATKVIKTLDDLSVVRYMGDPNKANANAYAIKGYYVLGNDIDGNGATLSNANSAWNAGIGFCGVLDGRGHTISNFSVGNYGLFGNLSGATVKNLRLEIKKCGSAVFANAIRGGRIENVHISVESTAYAGWFALAAEFTNEGGNSVGCVFKNVMFDTKDCVFDKTNGILCKTFNYGTFEEVTVKTKADNIIMGNTATKSGIEVIYY